MKVTSQQPAGSDLKSGKTTSADHALTPESALPSGTKSFASVLDSVETAGESPRAEKDKEENPLRPGETAPRTVDDRDRDRPGEPVSPEAPTAPLPQAVTPLESSGEEIVTARQILSVRDLDSVVLTIKNFPGHQPQAIIDLPNSVLQGLRVKLSEDSLGRINAEFLVRNDGVKAQIDGRAPDLIELLRFRGVNLAGLRTSVGAEFSSGDTDTRQRSGAGQPRAVGQTSGVASAANAPSSIEEPEIDSDGSLTYRA
jgi:hypothetical protein